MLLCHLVKVYVWGIGLELKYPRIQFSFSGTEIGKMEISVNIGLGLHIGMHLYNRTAWAQIGSAKLRSVVV